MIRLKIPKLRAVLELDDAGNKIPVETPESDLEDIPVEDSCLSMVAKIEDQRIWVSNQLAQKTVRSDISAEFRGMVDRLDNLDTQDFNFRLEKEANAFEELLSKLMDAQEGVETNAPQVPVFDFRVKY